MASVSQSASCRAGDFCCRSKWPPEKLRPRLFAERAANMFVEKPSGFFGRAAFQKADNSQMLTCLPPYAASIECLTIFD